MCGILSSNSSNNVTEFLNNHDLNFFDFISASSRIWGKNINLKKLLLSHGFNMDEVVYVGDEVRDIIAAKKVGIRVAAVTWGYNSKKALRSQKPDYLISSPEELLNL